MANLGGWIVQVIPLGFAIVTLILGNLFVHYLGLSKELRGLLLRVQFVIFLESLMFVGSVYIWRSVERALQGKRRPHGSGSEGSKGYTGIIRVLTAALLVFTHGSYPLAVILTGKDPHPIGFMSFVAVGFFIQFITCLSTMNFLHWISRLLSLGTRSRQVDDVQALRIKLSVTAVYSLIAVSYGVYCATQRPLVKHVEIPIRKLAPTLDGLRIVHVCDIHMGPTVGHARVSSVVDIVNSLKPDVVVLVGDLVDSTVNKLSRAAEPFKKLKAKKGKYFVTGNHEYHTSDVDNWFKFWNASGITVLHNSNVKIHSDQNPNHQICLCGTDDIYAETVGYGDHGFHLDSAVASCDDDSPIILLAHQPKAAKKALDSKHDIRLVLSGHTHGGQMFPLHVGAYFMNPFYVGLYKYGSGYVYVSPGTLYWGVPMRLGTQHEITEVTLRTT